MCTLGAQILIKVLNIKTISNNARGAEKVDNSAMKVFRIRPGLSLIQSQESSGQRHGTCLVFS